MLLLHRIEPVFTNAPACRTDILLSDSAMNEVQMGLERLRERIARERVSEVEFVAAVAEIVAATPSDLAEVDGLLIAREIREIENEWKASLERMLS